MGVVLFGAVALCRVSQGKMVSSEGQTKMLSAHCFLKIEVTLSAKPGLLLDLRLEEKLTGKTLIAGS